MQEWPLRVTLVYRREGSDWQLAHRHADPLFHEISLEGAAALAPGRPFSRSPMKVHANYKIRHDLWFLLIAAMSLIIGVSVGN